ncbi:uncharacterized protein LOC144345230 [Saccoglossus kowalevskii]
MGCHNVLVCLVITALVFQAKATVVISPPSARIPVGGRIEFQCTVEKLASGESIEWLIQKEGASSTPLNGSSDHIEITHTTSTTSPMMASSVLTISNAQLDRDPGSYICQVSDTSFTAVLTVYTGQALVTGPNDTVHARPGHTVTFNCKINNLSQAPEAVIWVYETTGTTVATIYPSGTTNISRGFGLDTSISNEYDLIIYDVNLEDHAGNYDCYFRTSRNPDGEVGRLVISTITTPTPEERSSNQEISVISKNEQNTGGRQVVMHMQERYSTRDAQHSREITMMGNPEDVKDVLQHTPQLNRRSWGNAKMIMASQHSDED